MSTYKLCYNYYSFLFTKKQMATEKIFWNNPHTIDLIERELLANKVILSSTDTIPGLMANLSIEAFKRLNEIKGRTVKPYLILIHDKKMLDLFSDSLQAEKSIGRLMDFCWPGPVTLILPAKKSLPPWIASPDKTVALRVPHHDGLLALLDRFPGLFSTSANKTEQPTPHLVSAVDQQIVQAVDHMVVDYTKTSHYVASTILDCTKTPLKINREGACSREQLEQWYGKPIES